MDPYCTFFKNRKQNKKNTIKSKKENKLCVVIIGLIDFIRWVIVSLINMDVMYYVKP